MKTTFRNSQVRGVDAGRANGQIVGTSLLFVLTAGREAGSSESASAFLEKESAEWLFSPRPGQASPTLGAKRSIPKRNVPLSRDVGPGMLSPEGLDE